MRICSTSETNKLVRFRAGTRHIHEGEGKAKRCLSLFLAYFVKPFTLLNGTEGLIVSQGLIILKDESLAANWPTERGTIFMRISRRSSFASHHTLRQSRSVFYNLYPTIARSCCAYVSV